MIRSGSLRASAANALHRGVSQGGSTITQQLAKNLFLTQERTLMRKLQEVVLALWLEHKFTKDQILELYLNRVYFGAGAYGVEAAAQRYYGKSARAVPPWPRPRCSRASSSRRRGWRRRATSTPPNAARQMVLAAMAERGLIKADAAKTGALHPPNVVKPSVGGSVELRRRLCTGRAQ